MKKIGLLLIVALFLLGCGTAAQRSEFYKHDAHYKNLKHLTFSWTGWRSPTSKDAKNSDKQRWWGEEVAAPSE